MSGANARDGRRRRMLQEEARGASDRQDATPSSSASQEPSERRRYALEAGSLGDLLANRHFPSHVLVPVGVGLAGIAAIAGLVALHVEQSTLNPALGGSLSQLINLTGAGSLGSWMASASMLAVAFLAAMVLTVRRRRVDDYRGRYRLWHGAIVAGIFLSIDAATSLHTQLAAAASHLVGVSFLSGGAEWWLAGGVLLGGWVGVRVLLDVKESRLALAIFLATSAAYGVGLASYFGWLPVAADFAATATHATFLTGNVLAVATLLAYARFLRRDVAGGVASRPQKSRTVESKPAPSLRTSPASSLPSSSIASSSSKRATSKRDQRETTPAVTPPPKKNKRAPLEKPAPATIQWTDGSEGGDDPYGEKSDPRKLSKSERKRLRKQKSGRRAA